MFINKKKRICHLVDFTVTVDNRRRKYRQSKKKQQKTKKNVEHVGDGDTSCNWGTWNAFQKFEKKLRKGNQRKKRDHPDNSIAKIG